MKIGHHIIGENHPVFIIAELSANHNGSLETALKLSAQQKGPERIVLNFKRTRRTPSRLIADGTTF